MKKPEIEDIVSFHRNNKAVNYERLLADLDSVAGLESPLKALLTRIEGFMAQNQVDANQFLYAIQLTEMVKVDAFADYLK